MKKRTLIIVIMILAAAFQVKTAAIFRARPGMKMDFCTLHLQQPISQQPTH